MQSRSSYILVALAALMGLVFGYGLGGNPTDSLLGALGLGALSAAGAFYAVMRSAPAGPGAGTDVNIPDPPLARFLFQDARSAALWLPVRFYIGWDFLQAGWHKFTGTGWMDSSAAIRGFWQGAV